MANGTVKWFSDRKGFGFSQDVEASNDYLDIPDYPQSSAIFACIFL